MSKHKKKNRQKKYKIHSRPTTTPMNSGRIPFSCIVKPVGARCNLRCEHCFYLDKTQFYQDPSAHTMSDELLERFVQDYLASQPVGTREINFVWQGGEPTLAGLDFFKRAVALEKKYAPPGMRVLNSFQTNGTLLDDEWGKFLGAHDFLVGISIDGPKPMHDRFRVNAAGGGSFEAAMRGLEALRKHRVEYNILTCVQSDNAEHGVEVYEFLKTLGTSFFQFIPIVEYEGLPPDSSRQNTNETSAAYQLSERSVSGEQLGRFMTGIFDRWLEGDVGRYFVQSFDVCLGLMIGHPAGVCVNSRHCGRGIVVEHNGDVYACDHYVFPEYRLGSLAKNRLREMVDGARQTSFGIAKDSGLPQVCRSCEYRNLCNGGCPAHRVVAQDGEEFGINHLCAGYRQFYGHALPIFRAMGRALQNQRPAADWKVFY